MNIWHRNVEREFISIGSLLAVLEPTPPCVTPKLFGSSESAVCLRIINYGIAANRHHGRLELIQ